MKQLIDANIERSPVLVCGGVRPGDTSADAAYARWPHGFCERVRPLSEKVDVDAWTKTSEDALPRIDFTGQPRPSGSWEEIVWGDYWIVRQIRAGQLIPSIAGHDESKRAYIEMAVKALEEIERDNPAPSPEVRKMLAIALGRLGLETLEQKRRAAGAWRDYIAVAPKYDPMLPAILNELYRLEKETR